MFENVCKLKHAQWTFDFPFGTNTRNAISRWENWRRTSEPIHQILCMKIPEGIRETEQKNRVVWKRYLCIRKCVRVYLENWMQLDKVIARVVNAHLLWLCDLIQYIQIQTDANATVCNIFCTKIISKHLNTKYLIRLLFSICRKYSYFSNVFRWIFVDFCFMNNNSSICKRFYTLTRWWLAHLNV